MITCFLTYTINPAQLAEFEAYARFWIEAVRRFGGDHHGYFLPHEGPNDIAHAAFSFPSLADYEVYRRQSGDDPACQSVYARAEAAGFILRYDRSFLRPVGTPSRQPHEP